MKTAMLMLSLLCLAACDSKSADVKSESKTGVPQKSDIADEVKSGVDHVLADKGAKWVVDYSGDLKGSIEGDVMAVTSMARMTVAAGKAMKSGKTGSATQEMMLKVTNYGDKPGGDMSLTLADGTKCSESMVQADRKAAKLNVIDPDRKTFKAEMSGVLKCGEAKDKTIKYTAKLNN